MKNRVIKGHDLENVFYQYRYWNNRSMTDVFPDEKKFAENKSKAIYNVIVDLGLEKFLRTFLEQK